MHIVLHISLHTYAWLYCTWSIVAMRDRYTYYIWYVHYSYVDFTYASYTPWIKYIGCIYFLLSGQINWMNLHVYSICRYVHSFSLEWENVLRNLDKVHIFWEGHKILRNLQISFVLCSASQSKLEISQNFVAFLEYINLSSTTYVIFLFNLIE